MIGLLDQEKMPEIYTKSELMRRVKELLAMPSYPHSGLLIGLEGVTIHTDDMHARKIVCYYKIPVVYVYFNNTVVLIE